MWSWGLALPNQSKPPSSGQVPPWFSGVSSLVTGKERLGQPQAWAPSSLAEEEGWDLAPGQVLQQIWCPPKPHTMFLEGGKTLWCDRFLFCKDWFLFKLSNIFGRKLEMPSKNYEAWFSPTLLCLRAKKLNWVISFFSPYCSQNSQDGVSLDRNNWHSLPVYLIVQTCRS